MIRTRAQAIRVDVLDAAVDGVVPHGGLAAIARHHHVTRSRVWQVARTAGVRGSRTTAPRPARVRGSGDYDLANLLGGCADTLTGWHVPSRTRKWLLGKTPHTEVLAMLGQWLAYETRHEDAPQDGRARCLCGWTPTEAALLALRAMYDAALADDPRMAGRLVDVGAPVAR